MADEEAVFDRQMRLWGVEAQAKIRSSRVLIRGPFLGLSSEICKNLALAGVNLAIQADHTPGSVVREEDVCTNVFFRADDVLASRTRPEVLDRIREMTFADVQCVEDNTKEEEQDLSQYKAVVSVNEPYEVMRQLGEQCRQSRVPLVCCREQGMLGFALLDFGEEFAFRRDGGEDQQEQHVARFSPLSALFAFDDFALLNKKTSFGFYAVLMAAAAAAQQKQQAKRPKLVAVPDTVKQEELDWAVKEFSQPPGASSPSLAPVCTILGGLVGNEVLKAVSGKGEPSNNFIFFDAKDCGAAVRQIPPPPPPKV